MLASVSVMIAIDDIIVPSYVLCEANGMPCGNLAAADHSIRIAILTALPPLAAQASRSIRPYL
jgi:hypothetical protein